LATELLIAAVSGNSSEMARRPTEFLREFIRKESSGGIILMMSAALALLVANSPLAPIYFDAFHTRLFGLDLLHWVNDALMALFFLLVGLEIKRELIVGHLATWRDRALPGFAAVGGMVVPALIYVAFNHSDPAAVRGWAIPSATDIAFSLGVLALLGSRVPLSLKIFLTALAILDDLGAVIIIAVFYTAGLSPVMIGLAAFTVAVLVVLNASRVTVLWPYVVLGLLLWYFVLRSGVHATIAGVLLAATIPVRGKTAEAVDAPEPSPLRQIEQAISPWVAYLVLPMFGFANAGVALGGIGLQAFSHPVTLGSALGLFVGKQLGVFAGAWITIRAGLAVLPNGVTWTQLYGIAILCGIGFTMSLFIGLLAFTTDEFLDATKIGVLLGSVASAVVGWIYLRIVCRA
jgi:Na+:H+ antiporter, NhaA family